MKTNKKVASESTTASARIDAILAREEQLVPSSGFVASVMDQVREEAAATPPIPFPWKRAIPGIALAAGVFGWGGFELVRISLAARAAMAPGVVIANMGSMLQHGSASGWRMDQAGWVVLAAGLSLGSWLFSRRIAGRS